MFSALNKFSRSSRSAVAVAVTLLLLACSASSPEELLASAKGYMAKGDYSAAVIQLKNALQHAPNMGEARLLLGEALLKARDLPSAEKELRRANELKQPDEKVLPLLAQAMSEQGRDEALITEFGDRNLDDRRAQASFQTLLGDAYLRNNERAQADKAFKAARAAQSDHPPALLGQARLMALDGKLDEALAQADAIIAAAPKLAVAYGFKSDLLLAKGDGEGSRKALEAAIKSDPDYLPARLALIALMTDKREFDAAQKLIDGARKVAPRDLRVTQLEASLAFHKGELDKARQHLQQVLKFLPEYVPALALAGAVELRDKKLPAAEIHLSKAIAREPNHAGARQMLVQTYLQSGQPVKAKEVLQPLVEKDAPTNARLQLLAGETFLANGDVRRATSFFEEAAKADGQEVAARTRLGQIALATGRNEEGLKELEAASAMDAGAYQADLALIANHLRRNEVDKAMIAVKSLEKKQPKNPLTFQMYGLVNLAKRDTEGARKSFEKALELQPNYLPAAYNLAQLDLLAKKPDDARKRYEAMIAKEPNNDRLYAALAELLVRMGSPKEAGPILQRGVGANPQSVDARLALINFHLGAGDPKAAIVAAREAVAALSSDPRILEAAARAQEAAGEMNQAIETYNRLAAQQPTSVQPLLRLANLYLRQNETDRAIDTLRRAQRLAPKDVGVVPQIVQVYLAANRADDALKEVHDLQKRHPKLATAHALEGEIYVAQKKFAQAEQAFREALKLEPKADVVAVRLHELLSATGKAAEADSFAKKWIAGNPKDATMRLYLAERELRAKNLKAAAAHYQAAIAINENNALALNNLAWIGGEVGDPKALSYAERAVAIAPASAAILDTYGTLLVKKGEIEKGLQVLERAQKLSPARNDLRLNYAKALLAAGKKADARKELEALRDSKQPFQGKDEIPDLLKRL